MEHALVISSDGHAMANMPDYRQYLPTRMHEEFDAFCAEYEEHGYHTFDPESMLGRTDADVVQRWVESMHACGRLDGNSDPGRRLEILEDEGIVAEVLFPDFGLPFEMVPPTNRMRANVIPYRTRTRDEIDAGNRAHNRWLRDFCSVAPERFAPMLSVLFDDIPAAIEEIRWGKEAGFKGVLIPIFSEQAPLFDVKFDPIWATLAELQMPANSHIALSATVPMRSYATTGVAHPAITYPLHRGINFFRCHEILNHLIWGGVLDRHPGLRVCLTEQGSAWVRGSLQKWDYQFDGSYLRRDLREVVRRPPSEYWNEQGFLGSSIFTRDEIGARHEIGLTKMCLGMDYPHHEGTFAEGGTTEYLRATLGAEHVHADEARLLLGGNHAQHWGFDLDALRPVADRVGPSLDLLLTPPEDDDLFPRGDVRKPLEFSGA